VAPATVPVPPVVTAATAVSARPATPAAPERQGKGGRGGLLFGSGGNGDAGGAARRPCGHKPRRRGVCLNSLWVGNTCTLIADWVYRLRGPLSVNGEGTRMAKHRAPSKDRLAGGLLLGAVASGLAAAALGGAGAANATCASISGVGAGAGCTSTPTSFAIGLGPGTEVNAQGLFNGAIAVGTETEASATGVGNLAVAVGNPGVNGQVMAVVPTDAIATGTF
jgi:hypothetical protein